VGGRRLLTFSLRDVTEQKRIEKEQRFLAEVGALLASTLDYQDTLDNIGRLAVRDLADFCNIDSVEDDGTVKRLKAMSRNPANAWVCDLFMRNPLDRSCPYFIRAVVASKRPVIIERLSVETIASFAENDEDRRALRDAGLSSLIAVPLMVRRKLVGLIALIASTGSRAYRHSDIRLAEELAQRAAFSLENAHLFREAKRAVETREDVLAIVSHDLKNPVSTIGLVAHLLRQFDELDADKASKLADTIQRSVDRMRILLTDLLDFAKIQSGTFTVETHEDSVIRLAGSVIESLRLLAESKRQTIETDLPAGLPVVAMDPNRIGQVMSNLLGNAIKFTPDGGTIRIAARQHGQEVIVSVADTGPGISSEHLPRVFDWFWQAQRSKHMGSGLGLSIAKGIVEAHHGRIWAESRVGRGSSFSFTLPLTEEGKRAA
jgi:signal transduction histidine kinase